MMWWTWRFAGAPLAVVFRMLRCKQWSKRRKVEHRGKVMTPPGELWTTPWLLPLHEFAADFAVLFHAVSTHSSILSRSYSQMTWCILQEILCGRLTVDDMGIAAAKKVREFKVPTVPFDCDPQRSWALTRSNSTCIASCDWKSTFVFRGDSDWETTGPDRGLHALSSLYALLPR